MSTLNPLEPHGEPGSNQVPQRRRRGPNSRGSRHDSKHAIVLAYLKYSAPFVATLGSVLVAFAHR
jgi:hypothetical protein